MDKGTEESLARGLAQAARGEAIPRDDLLTDTGPTLTDFLLARIAQDEAGPGDTWEIRNGYGVQRVLRTSDEPSPRVLAECEAKRRIVEECREGIADDCAEMHYDQFERIMFALALPYADHEDFRDAWRP